MTDDGKDLCLEPHPQLLAYHDNAGNSRPVRCTLDKGHHGAHVNQRHSWVGSPKGDAS